MSNGPPPAAATVSGPPESPLQLPRPPAVEMQSVLGMMIPPKVAVQTALLTTLLVVERKFGEVADEPSLMRPHPDTVASCPVKRSVS